MTFSNTVEDVQTLLNDPHYAGPILRKLRYRVLKQILNGGWYTVQSLSLYCNGTETSVSSCLRDLRKPQHGGLKVVRRRKDEHALSEYRLELNDNNTSLEA